MWTQNSSFPALNPRLRNQNEEVDSPFLSHAEIDRQTTEILLAKLNGNTISTQHHTSHLSHHVSWNDQSPFIPLAEVCIGQVLGERHIYFLSRELMVKGWKNKFATSATSPAQSNWTFGSHAPPPGAGTTYFHPEKGSRKKRCACFLIGVFQQYL